MVFIFLLYSFLLLPAFSLNRFSNINLSSTDSNNYCFCVFCVFCFIVCVHDESGDNLVLLRSVGSLHIRAIECCAFSEELNQIATGSTNGSLHMIDYDRLRLKSNNVQHQGNMTSIEFIQPNQKNEMKPIVISADTNGIICIW